MRKPSLKMPADQQVTLAAWTDKRDYFERIGDGRDYTEHGGSIGSVRLSFRAFHTESREMSHWITGSPAELVSDIGLRIFLHHDGQFGMDFLGMHITYADPDKLEKIAQLIRQWTSKADKLFLGGSESFDTCLRRYLTGAGVSNAVMIQGGIGTRTHSLMPLDTAIPHVVMPAVDRVRGKLKRYEAA